MTYSYSKILSVSLPILFGLFIQQLIGLTDTAFLGRVGEIELGASALAGVFYIMIYMLALGFGIGVQIIVARRNGENNQNRIGAVVYQGISFLMLAAIIIIAATLSAAPAFFERIISSAAVREQTLNYLNIRIYGFLFAFPVVILRAFYVGITQTKILSWSALAMMLSNIILDYILIFGKFGAPQMGIAGAALASVVCEAICLIYFVVYMLLYTDLKKFGLERPILYNKKILKQIWDLSIWTMLQYFVSMATWFLFLTAIEHLGEAELAISNILRSVSVFPYIIVAALGAAANSITGNLIGSGKDAEVIATSDKIIKTGYVIGLAMVAFMALFPRVMLRIYTDNSALIDAAIAPYYSSLSTFFTLVPGMILLSVVSGTGQTKTAMYMELAALTVYTFNIWYAVIFMRADLYICWLSEHSYNIFISILTFMYLQRQKWCCKIV